MVKEQDVIEKGKMHGSLNNLKEKYPELINGDTSDNEYGTIIDDKLNITEENIDECCVCLCEYVKEMNCYFEKY